MARTRNKSAVAGVEPAAKDPRVSPYELFYDLVFAGAILGLSLDFGKSEKWSAFWVAATTFAFAWWIWQETVLFTNRFGDPLKPIASRSNRREAILSLAARWLCVLQMIAIVLVALYEPAKLDVRDLSGSFAWACAGALAALALLREVGAIQRPDLRKEVAHRRPWEIIAIALLVADALNGANSGPGFWLGALAATILPGFYFEIRDRKMLSAGERRHLAERLMLFVLIISGDIFLKIIVYWNADIALTLHPLQLIFVSSIVFSVFRLYISRVETHKPPGTSWRFLGWLLLHLVLSYALLVAAGGMVEYVTPKDNLTYYHLMSAGWGVAVAVGCIAALDWIGGGAADRRRAIGLGFVALLVGLGATAATYLTPDDWRIGMAVMAVILLFYVTPASWMEAQIKRS